MMIHKELLTHDGVASNTAGKVIDLGFNGDFDVKNNAWNMVFVALPKATYYGAVSVTVETENAPAFVAGGSYTQNKSYIKKAGCVYKFVGTTGTVSSWSDSDWTKLDLAGVAAEWDNHTSTTYHFKNELATFSVDATKAANGGVFGLRMPQGLGRYFTLAISGAKSGSDSGYHDVTAGITDQVDTDCNPGVDWTFYKAETAEVNQPGRIETAAAKLDEGTASSIADAAVATHAALTTGVHGLA